MRFLKTLILLLFITIFGVQAQDNYTVNIRYGRNVAVLDSAIAKHVIQIEEEEGDLYEGLYGSWKNSGVNPYGMNLGTMKDSFYINVAGYFPPVLGRVTSNFGPRSRGFHNGIDLKVNVGDTIRAAFNGRIRVQAFNKKGYGYYVVLRNHDGIETIYAHLSKFLVSPNQDVKAGQPIGLGGNTGRSTGPHLHFEFRIFGNPINPAKLFSFEDYIPLQRRYFVAKAKTFEERIKYSGGSYFGVKLAAPGPDLMNRSGGYQKGEYAEVKFHTVKKGENLFRIAKDNGLSVADLCKLNNLGKNASIKPGQRLRLS